MDESESSAHPTQGSKMMRDSDPAELWNRADQGDHGAEREREEALSRGEISDPTQDRLTDPALYADEGSWYDDGPE